MKAQALTILVGLLALTGCKATTIQGADAVAECADAERGAVVYEKCAICHSLDADGTHGVAGPNLAGIVGAPIGKREGFRYSRTLRLSEDKWTTENLRAFLRNPLQAYPGTSMGFAGIRDDGDLDALLCHLSQRQ